jgi:O-antigen ligase
MLLWAATLAGIVSVILSLARGSWIGLVTVMALLIGLGWYKLSAGERKRYFVTVFAAAILLSIVLSPFAGRIYDRLAEDDQGSAQIRVPLMETALRMIEDNPAVGVGLNGYRTNMTRYDETGMFVSQVFPNPVHNIFAHITAEAGIIGGAIFCLLIAFSLFESFRSMGSDDRLLAALSLGLGLGMIAFIISGIKEPGSLGSARPPMRMCFFLFGAILAISRMRRRTVFRA